MFHKINSTVSIMLMKWDHNFLNQKSVIIKKSCHSLKIKLLRIIKDSDTKN